MKCRATNSTVYFLNFPLLPGSGRSWSRHSKRLWVADPKKRHVISPQMAKSDGPRGKLNGQWISWSVHLLHLILVRITFGWSWVLSSWRFLARLCSGTGEAEGVVLLNSEEVPPTHRRATSEDCQLRMLRLEPLNKLRMMFLRETYFLRRLTFDLGIELHRDPFRRFAESCTLLRRSGYYSTLSHSLV